MIANSEKEKDEIVLSQRLRLADDRIEHYLKGVIHYFKKLSLLDKQIKTYFKSGSKSGIAQIARSQNESNILFRPVGQLIFAEVIGALSSEYGSKNAFVYAKKIPISLNETPYNDVIWDSENRRIFAAKNKGIASKLLQYMLGLEINQKEKLREKYSDLRDIENGRLPNKLL